MSDQQLLQKQQKQQKQQQIAEPQFENAKQIEDYINNVNMKTVDYDGYEYDCFFYSEQEQQETQEILKSDKALEKYYENNHPEMLKGLKSKSFINLPGKKAERKKLRKAHLDKRAAGYSKPMLDEYRKNNNIDPKESDEKLLESKRNQEADFISSYIKIYEGTSEKASHELKIKTLEMNPVKRDKYCKLLVKLKDKKIAERTKLPVFKEFKLYTETFPEDKDWADMVESGYLFNCKENEKENFLINNLKTRSHYQQFINGDLNGQDSPQLRDYQTKVAQIYNKGVDYKAFRLKRRLEAYKSTIDMPEIVKKDMQSGKPKYTPGDYNRTCLEFMKPVKYKMENDKEVPATIEDQMNLEYNIHWSESLLSDNEKDWDFRFEEMVNHIDTIYKNRKADMEYLISKFDEEKGKINIDEDHIQKYIDDLEQLRMESGRTLICSGVGHNSEQNDLFKSKYFKKLSPERQNELNVKNEMLYNYSNIIKGMLMKIGVDMDNANYVKEGEEKQADFYMVGFVINMKENINKI